MMTKSQRKIMERLLQAEISEFLVRGCFRTLRTMKEFNAAVALLRKLGKGR